MTAHKLIGKLLQFKGFRCVGVAFARGWRLDADVLSWFKAQGPGYQTRINELLREYVRAHREREQG